LSDYKIFETRQFLDDLEEIHSDSFRKKIYNKIINYVYPQIQKNPFFGQNIKKLIDYTPPTWRYRIGSYRLFYEIDEKERIVFIIVFEIRHRGY